MTKAGPVPLRPAGAALRAFAPDDVGPVLRLWDASIGQRYPLRPEVLELTLAADPTTVVRAAVAELDGAVVGFAFAGTSSGGHGVLDPLHGRVWLQAVLVAPDRRRRGIGTALARTVVNVGRDVAVGRDIAVGRDFALDLVDAGGGLHYLWPGVPDDLPAAGPFLEALGFAFDTHVSYDLRADVTGLRIDDGTRRVLTAAGLTVRPAQAADRDALLAFILREFGAAWWHDTGYFLEAGGDPADELLLIDRGGAIRGFARLHTPASRPPGWPMFWHPGPRAGGLGPIGLAADARGRGLGRAFLVSALDRLRTHGATDVVIDDTTLLGYYGPHGFVPWITYRHAVAPIGRLAEDRRPSAGEER